LGDQVFGRAAELSGLWTGIFQRAVSEQVTPGVSRIDLQPREGHQIRNGQYSAARAKPLSQVTSNSSWALHN
jgi:hypothetical protein